MSYDKASWYDRMKILIDFLDSTYLRILTAGTYNKY